MTDTSQLSAAELADALGGRVIGDAAVVLEGVRSLHRAGPRHVSFCSSSRYSRALLSTRAGAVLVDGHNGSDHVTGATQIVVDDAARAAARAIELFCGFPSQPWGISPSARVGDGVRWTGRLFVGAHAAIGRRVRFGADCVVEAGAVIEDDVTCGDRCRIGPHATVHTGTRLGTRVTLEAGARVGGAGFGFLQGPDGHERFPHVGGCEIADDVEIGANATVDQGKLDPTVIGPGTKIDNLVHIGHTVRIGARCMVLAQVGIAGSVVVEDEVLLAGQAGIADHLTVGRGARVAAQSGVIGDVSPGTTVSGYPARAHRDVLRQAAAVRRLTPLASALERIVAEP